MTRDFEVVRDPLWDNIQLDDAAIARISGNIDLYFNQPLDIFPFWENEKKPDRFHVLFSRQIEERFPADRDIRVAGPVLRLGTLGFGGPVALVGYMYRDLVEQRGWISDADYKEGMALAHSETLEFRLRLERPEDRANLLAMTPHGWRASAERRAAVIAEPLEVTVAIRYDWIERTGH